MSNGLGAAVNSSHPPIGTLLREWRVIVVGDNQNKYFKIKTRMFKSLF
jgi:hypothetical protein